MTCNGKIFIPQYQSGKRRRKKTTHTQTKPNNNSKTNKQQATPLCLYFFIDYQPVYEQLLKFSNLQNLFMKLLYLSFFQSLTYNVSAENLNTKPSCTCTLSTLLEFRVPYSLLGSVHNALFGKDIQIVCSTYTVFSEPGEVQSGRIWENAVIIVDLACSDQGHK